ncbi:hypothetical protein THRCLA_01550, partial [Thraustotheca clavata]
IAACENVLSNRTSSWVGRVSAMKKLETAAMDISIDEHQEHDKSRLVDALTVLVDGLLQSLDDGRPAVVKQTCSLVSSLAWLCGPAFEVISEILLLPVLELATKKKQTQVIALSARQCLHSMTKATRYRVGLLEKAFKMAKQDSDKRMMCLSLMVLLLRFWMPEQVLEQNNYQSLRKVILKSLFDQDTAVQTQARMAFCLLCEYGQENLRLLHEQLPPELFERIAEEYPESTLAQHYYPPSIYSGLPPILELEEEESDSPQEDSPRRIDDSRRAIDLSNVTVRNALIVNPKSSSTKIDQEAYSLDISFENMPDELSTLVETAKPEKPTITRPLTACLPSRSGSLAHDNNSFSASKKLRQDTLSTIQDSSFTPSTETTATTTSLSSKAVHIETLKSSHEAQETSIYSTYKNTMNVTSSPSYKSSTNRPTPLNTSQASPMLDSESKSFTSPGRSTSQTSPISPLRLPVSKPSLRPNQWLFQANKLESLPDNENSLDQNQDVNFPSPKVKESPLASLLELASRRKYSYDSFDDNESSLDTSGILNNREQLYGPSWSVSTVSPRENDLIDPLDCSVQSICSNLLNEETEEDIEKLLHAEWGMTSLDSSSLQPSNSVIHTISVPKSSKQEAKTIEKPPNNEIPQTVQNQQSEEVNASQSNEVNPFLSDLSQIVHNEDKSYQRLSTKSDTKVHEVACASPSPPFQANTIDLPSLQPADKGNIQEPLSPTSIELRRRSRITPDARGKQTSPSNVFTPNEEELTPPRFDPKSSFRDKKRIPAHKTSLRPLRPSRYEQPSPIPSKEATTTAKMSSFVGPIAPQVVVPAPAEIPLQTKPPNKLSKPAQPTTVPLPQENSVQATFTDSVLWILWLLSFFFCVYAVLGAIDAYMEQKVSLLYTQKLEPALEVQFESTIATTAAQVDRLLSWLETWCTDMKALEGSVPVVEEWASDTLDSVLDQLKESVRVLLH